MRRAWILLLALLGACGNDGEPSTAAAPAGTIELSDTAAQVIITSAAARVSIDKASLELELSAGQRRLTQSAAPTLLTANGSHALERVRSVTPLYRDGTLRGAILDCKAGDSTARFHVDFLSDRSIATRVEPAEATTVGRIVTTLQAAPDEHYYGLMQRTVDAVSASIRDRQISEVSPQAVGGLDRRGTSVTMIVTPTIGLYTPFFHSSRGYGVYVEGTMPGTYDLAKTDSQHTVIDFEFNQRLGQHSVVFFVGDHASLLDQYTALSGRPFVPPRWGFKHWRWRGEHEVGTPALLDGTPMNAQLVEDVTMYEQLGIPVGNYEFDRPWTSGEVDRGEPGFASFTFDPQRFPNTPAMLAAMKQRGYHLFVWGGPWALGENAVDAERFGYYAPRNDILIDFTNPNAVAWWQGRVATLIEQGIQGMKLDRGEMQPTSTELPDVPDKASDIWFDGRNGREMKNAYIGEFAKTHFDVFRAHLGGDFLHYYRAGYAGTQKYGVFWGGDITAKTQFGLGLSTDLGLRSALLGLMHVAFMGFPIWGTDTGGYYEFADREVFARWLEFSAVNPIMEIGGVGAHTPWNMPTEPKYDDEMIDIYRRYTTLHHELVPLLYSLALEAGASGRPIARPLVFEFPDDPEVANLWDEFLLGSDLLVAPVWQSGARSRDVYFPHGTWIDVDHPDRRFSGPAHETVDAALDVLPRFARAGAILPLEVANDVTGNGSTASAERLTLDTYPSGQSQLILREDAGSSTFTLTDAECGPSPCAKLSIGPSQRGYVVRMLTPAPARVTVGGRDLSAAASFTEWETLSSGWYYESSSGRLWARFATDGAGVELTATSGE